MSDVPPRSGTTGQSPFSPLAVALLIAVGIAGFVGMLLMGAFAPDLRSGQNGGGHALSNSATGFSGLVRLAAETGRDPHIARSERQLATEELVVLTPGNGSADIGKILALRPNKPTLVILPKWATLRDPDRPGWVRAAGLVSRFEPETVLAPQFKLSVQRRRSGGVPLRSVSALSAGLRFMAPRPLQTMTGAGLDPLVTDGQGRVVLGSLGEGYIYVLADPDLLDNRGMADAAQAAAALAMLDRINSTGATAIHFDVTLNGFGRSRSALKLPFEPPYLAMTLTLAAAMLLAGWQAIARFGPVQPRARAIAFGKAALIDNSAALVRKARREGALGSRYAALVRDRALAAFAVPTRLRAKDAEADAYLDGLAGRERFTDLAAAAGDTRRPDKMLAAAQALHRWQQEKTA